VIAYDAIDQYDEDEITVTVVDEPPKKVSIKVLPDQTPVSGTVEITVSAEDYRGIQTINVFMDDELLETWDEGPLSVVDFKFNLDTTQYADDDYIIRAVAIDTANQEKAVEIIINIQNQSSRSVGSWQLASKKGRRHTPTASRPPLSRGDFLD
jgi:hypothetical protein